MNTSPRSILVVHIAGLEETVLALPALHSLRTHLPEARLTAVSSPAGAGLLELTGIPDRILAVSRFRHGEILNPAGLYRSARVIEELKRSPYDIAIEFKSGAESSIVLAASRTSERLKPGRLSSPEAIIARVSEMISSRMRESRHLAHQYLKTLEPLGVRPAASEPRIRTVREADLAADKLFQKHRVGTGDLLVGIHPGAGRLQDRWPVERFASIASRMVHNFGARVVVFSGPQERPLAGKIAKMMPAGSAIVIRSPKMVDFVSVAARLSLLVANHSGPAHIAAAAGTPVVAASVSTDPSDHDLLGSTVEHVRAPHIEMVPEEEIYEAACRLLRFNRAKFLSSRE